MAGSARFTKAQRLLKRGDFDRVQHGEGVRRGSSAHFLVLLGERAGQAGASPPPARLGIIASRRVGSAVRRNRAKRLVREYFRLAAGTLGSFDMVVVVKTGAESLSAAQAAEELAGAYRRALASAPRGPAPRRPSRPKKAVRS